MQEVIQEILDSMKEITGINALRSRQSLSETEKKCSDNVPIIRAIISDLLKHDGSIKTSIGDYHDCIMHLVPARMNVGFCGEVAYQFIFEYFRKTGQKNISFVVSLKYSDPSINHTFVIIGTDLEQKLNGLGYGFETFFQDKCSQQDILVDPLTGQFFKIEDKKHLRTFINEYQRVSYVNTIRSYHSNNVLQQLINHDSKISEWVIRTRFKLNVDKLSEILRLYLKKGQDNKIFYIIDGSLNKLLIIPDDLKELARIKNYFIDIGICNTTEIEEIPPINLPNIEHLNVILQRNTCEKCLIIKKIEPLELDLIIHHMKQKIEASIFLTKPISFFAHPHRMINDRLLLGCDAPIGSVVDQNDRTVVPSL